MYFPRNRLFWAVGLGHFVNDVFMSMGPVLLAFLSVTILPMTNTQIGLTVSAAQLMGAVSQPVFGLAADRTGGRWLGTGGVMWTVGFFLLALVGAQTGYFWLMLIPFVTAAIGSAAFHPVGAMHASDSDDAHSASNTAYFFLLGQMGLALGPALAGMLLDLANPANANPFVHVLTPVIGEPFRWSGSVAPIFAMALMLVPAVALMTLALPNASHFADGRRAAAEKSASLLPRAIPWKAFAILGVVVALRSLAQPGTVTFIPVLFQNKGWGPAQYGAITSSFWLASGVMGVVFGNIADHYDSRRVVAIGLVLAAPAFFLLPVVDGPVAFGMAIIAGGLSGGSHSIIVVLAQELIPGAKGFASGAILGFIFGTGALGSVAIGTLSDSIGLGTTFQIVAALLVVASLVALVLPVRESPAASREVEAAETQPKAV